MHKVVKILQKGGVGILATDTLYGVVARALNEAAVERIYKLKGRRLDKPFIILISDYEDLKPFVTKLDDELKERLAKYWPGPASVILPCRSDKLTYLHRGGHTLAFRMPAKRSLRRLIKQTGPLVAPSANPENSPPAKNIKEAKKYFGTSVDFYRRGNTTKRASKIIKLHKNKEEIIRD